MTVDAAELAATNHVLPEDGVLRVAATSNPQQLASAIAHAVYAGQAPRLRAIGAGAVNQAVKALAIASGYVAPTGRVLSFRTGLRERPGPARRHHLGDQHPDHRRLTARLLRHAASGPATGQS